MDLVDEHTVDDTKFKVTGTGEYKRCEALLLSFVKNQTVACTRPPCSFNGVHQSKIDYNNAEFYGFAEFWYSTNDVLRIGGQYSYKKLQQTAEVFICKQLLFNKEVNFCYLIYIFLYKNNISSYFFCCFYKPHFFFLILGPLQNTMGNA